VADPTIVLVCPSYADELRAPFRRYVAEYDLRIVTDPLAVTAVLEQVRAGGGQVALIVAESRMPDVELAEVFGDWHAVAPTARRLVVAHVQHFLVDGPLLRADLAKGSFDAYLLLPRGVRDEEFHHAVTDLLSDWGSTSVEALVETVRIIAPAPDARTVAIGDYLYRMGMPARLFPPDSPEGREVLALVPGEPTFPVVRVLDRAPLQGPTVRQVAVSIHGRPADIDVDDVVDLAIVGAGPGGLAAAVYGASEGLQTVVLEAEAIGGQAGTSSMIRNYLGFPRGISGMRLAQRARTQALRFGTRFFTGWPVTAIAPGADGDPHVLHTGGGSVRARAVVIAQGVTYRRLGVAAVEELVGRGVFYGAALTASRSLEGADAYVVGGGNSAGQAALHLARFADSVTVVIRRSDLSQTMSDYLVGEIMHHPRVQVRAEAEVVDAHGDPDLDSITILDRSTGRRTEHPARGLFLLLGADPDCSWLPADIRLDERGFVLTGAGVPASSWVDGAPPAPLATSCPGIFAVGDVRAASMKRVASAAGEGASVVPLVHRWLEAARSGGSTGPHLGS
jgi:thioredoxin reductase (NADPH)